MTRRVLPQIENVFSQIISRQRPLSKFQINKDRNKIEEKNIYIVANRYVIATQKLESGNKMGYQFTIIFDL